MHPSDYSTTPIQELWTPAVNAFMAVTMDATAGEFGMTRMKARRSKRREVIAQVTLLRLQAERDRLEETIRRLAQDPQLIWEHVE